MFYIITTHAVEQYIKRFCPDKNHQEAKQDIQRDLQYSKSDVKSFFGDKTRSLGDVRFVIKDENVCVTVLPSHTDSDQEESDFLKEAHASAEENIKNEIVKTEQTILTIKNEKSKLSIQLNELNNRIQDLKNRLKEINLISTFNER
jgi:hypothetical protein